MVRVLASRVVDRGFEPKNYKNGGRVRLKDIQNMLAKDFNIHYQDINGVHYLLTKLGLSWISARSKHPRTLLPNLSFILKPNINFI
jgi:transposase